MSDELAARAVSNTLVHEVPDTEWRVAIAETVVAGLVERGWTLTPPLSPRARGRLEAGT